MNRRLVFSALTSLVTTGALAALVRLGPTEARILIAPAWMFGAAIASNARHPNGLAVWVSLFLMCLALVYFFPRSPKTKLPEISSSRQAAELLVLYAVLVAEFLCFRIIGTFLLQQTGGAGDVGSAYLILIFSALLPSFLICGIVLTLLYFRIARSELRAPWRVLFGLLSVNVVFYLSFTAFYFARLAG
jgi:hypothetical protein